MTISAEIICIGTELLLGEILNSNAQYLAQQLASLGIPHFYQTVVGDNPERIQKSLAIAANRSNLIITTGGLGPTPDDLTTESIADFFATPLVEHPQIWENIQQKYAGRTITANNRKQAFLPQGAEILTNPVGTAPGMIWQPRQGLMILTFPGVPTELYPMWEQFAVPVLRSQGWVKETFYSKVLLYWGIAESALAEQVNSFFDLTNPTVAPYANYGQARLRITARAETLAAAQALIAPVEAEIRQITGKYCYGVDDDTLAGVVGNHLKSQGQTLAVAESCTGGWLGETITSVAGSSAYFLGGVISYSNEVKAQVLKVSQADLQEHGAVSSEVAMQMALGVKNLLQSDWAISITGIAGPDGGSSVKPIGLVYIGLADPDGNVEAIAYKFNPHRDRHWIRMVSVYSALDQLRQRFVMI
ncbi:competence/damage-inducible protein CinA-like protein [Synechococcus sp. PCC 7502]|uniref:competence/damage-inducible protein A n=1 Tax=Synechococcus sp. PCC 7502 TaxID=1173263 RepID=UPI00029FDC23|nr:competence/damage-inducible protein A [Synechococcus sp. PCC 7502]AFY73977.1 competence/damage-inducible protein CinA-like protein [Synechococcus sp. PCC 7502]